MKKARTHFGQKAEGDMIEAYKIMKGVDKVNRKLKAGNITK